MLVVQFSALWGIPIREVYEMTPKEFFKYGDTYTEKMAALKDDLRYIVFEGIRKANSNKIKKFEPLFTKHLGSNDNGPATEQELEILRGFLNKKE